MLQNEKYCALSLPFLVGNETRYGVCGHIYVNAVQAVLTIFRKGPYGIKKRLGVSACTKPEVSKSKEKRERRGLIDFADACQRQHIRNGNRLAYVSVAGLNLVATNVDVRCRAG